jgi:4-hydroxy-3-methylbut-2-en-1-yl diphosphate reductase
MNIETAKHLGMCFGVRDALRTTHEVARIQPVTLLGQLVHNPLVDRVLKTLGVQNGSLDTAHESATRDVVISAHGASDTKRDELARAGLRVTDTTCPLVRKAHDALRLLVEEGYFPVVIGQRQHTEVRGLTGDFPEACVILDQAEITSLPSHPKIGIISQTTQPIERVLALVAAVKSAHPQSEVRFVDTVCHPTKQRQTALEDLCSRHEIIVIIGGKNSNNTRQLVEKTRTLGREAVHIESAADLRAEWFTRASSIGVTAGTSTLDETVQEVVERLRQMTAEAKE